MPPSHEPAQSTHDTVDEPIAFTHDPSHTLGDLAGLADERDRLETVVTALAEGVPVATHGVLVHGPGGNGKTRIADAVAGELADRGFSVGWVDGTDGLEAVDADLNEAVERAARAAVDTAPCVLVLDDMFDHRASAMLPRLRDRLTDIETAGERVLVVATADPSNASGDLGATFETSVAVTAPDGDRATTLLSSFLDEFAAETVVGVDVDTASERVRGVAAGTAVVDLRAGAKRAVQEAAFGEAETVVTGESLRRAIESVVESKPPTPYARPSTDDSGPRRVEATDVTFGDIGGLDEVKAELRAALEFPEQFADLYDACDLDVPGVLLYGTPGNGKTMLAKALATEYDRAFVAVDAPSLKNKYVGETERTIREVFETARRNAPSVVFIDEIDAIAGSREEASASHEVGFVNALLAELDGFTGTERVFVVAATNRPQAVDGALLREGRLGRHVHVPVPDGDAARAVVERHVDSYPLADDVTPAWIEDVIPDGAPAATIAGVCEQALRWHAMRRASESGSKRPSSPALTSVQPSTSTRCRPRERPPPLAARVSTDLSHPSDL
ncbi:AAA family ATPase [Halobaculum litoreum]|uniref:AAA family ATPase n=1 Tax=Halobaculum litoreum TaxID=3031998 RepID=A0ABD5XR92_9EURY